MQFAEAEKHYRYLDDAYRRGHLTDQDYQAAVNQISVQDDYGKAWKIQVYSGQWHVFEAGRWIAAVPPLELQPLKFNTEPAPMHQERQTQQPVVNQPQKSKPPNRLRKLGCILLPLAAVVCITGSLFIFGVIGVGLLGQTPSQVSVIQSQSVTLDPSGGSYQIGDFLFQLQENNLNSPITITLTEYQMPLKPMAVSQTHFYEIDGLPVDFQGRMSITLWLPDQLMDGLDRHDPGSVDNLVLYLGSTSFSRTGGGFVEIEMPAQAEFDLINQLVHLTIEPEDISEGLIPGGVKMASLNRSVVGQPALTDAAKRISFTVRNVGTTLRILESENFILTYYWDDITEDQASGMIHQLENSRLDLISMGWRWDPRWVRLTDYKIPVYKSLKPNHKADAMYGIYHYSNITGPGLTIYPKAFEGNPDLLTATIGHELMHHAQMIAHLQRDGISFLKDRQNDWFMLDEAMATWYESQATNNPDWLPAQALLNIEFYRETPWFFMTSGDANTEGAGYGASWFIRFFVNSLGTDSLRTAYQTNGIISGTDALVFAAQLEGASISLLFLDFLEVYFYFPEQFSAELIESPEYRFLLNRTLTLEATKHALKFNGRLITRDGREKKIDVKTIDGKIEDGLLTEPPWALISVELPASMTAYFFHFQIPEEGTLWQDSAVVTIQPETGGMFVHAYNLETDSWETLAGQTNFLSKGVRDSLTIDVNKYSDLEIVIFNTTGISNSAYQFASVAIIFDPGEIPIAPEQPIIPDPAVADFNAELIFYGALDRFGFDYEPEDIKHGCDHFRCMFIKTTDYYIHANGSPVALEYWKATLIADNNFVICQNAGHTTEDFYRGFTTLSCKYYPYEGDYIVNEVYIRGENWHLQVTHEVNCRYDGLTPSECEAQHSSVYDLVDAFIEEMASQNMIE